MARKKGRRKSGLSRIAQDFAIALIYEASSGTIGKVKAVPKDNAENPITFRDRRALLDSITKLLGTEDENGPEEEEAGIENYRERLNGPSGKTGSGADSDAV